MGGNTLEREIISFEEIQKSDVLTTGGEYKSAEYLKVKSAPPHKDQKTRAMVPHLLLI
jgi:hypothetical protein